MSPLIGDWNFTPSSVILRSAPRLNTWKPPESVRMGPSQPMKRCSPPCAAITSSPGPQPQVEGVAEHDLRADLAQLRGRHRLHRAVGADRHEGRRLDLAVGERERAAARGAVGGVEREFHRGDFRPPVVTSS